MAYTTEAELAAVIPASFLAESLDDEKIDDGAIDATMLASVLSVVDTEIDGLIAPAVALPLAEPYPARIRAAALVLACDALYRRRGLPDEANPWKDRAAKARETLEDVGAGNKPLDADASLAGDFDDTRDLIFDETDD